MRRFCVCLIAVLIQTSCTRVEDFGAYWNRGFVDAALQGSWKKLGLPGQNPDDIPGPDQWRFVKDGSSYALQAINPIDDTAPPDEIAQRKADNEQRVSARSLRIGKQLILMQREPGGSQGSIERYEVKRGVLEEYWIDDYMAVAFLEAKHPTAVNIHRNEGEGEYVVIDTFDDEVFAVLSEIADNPSYWRLTCRYKQVP
jgi:hypothetical protein